MVEVYNFGTHFEDFLTQSVEVRDDGCFESSISLLTVWHCSRIVRGERDLVVILILVSPLVGQMLRGIRKVIEKR